MSHIAPVYASRTPKEFREKNQQCIEFGKKGEVVELFKKGTEWTAAWKARQEKQEIPIDKPRVFSHAEYKDELPRTLLYDPAEDRTYLLATRSRSCQDPLLGEGKTSRVKLAIAEDKTYAVSVTRFKKVNEHTKERIRNLEVLEMTRGATRLIQEKCRAETDEKLYCVREFGNCGDLFDAIFSGFIQSLPLKNQLLLFRDLVEAVLQLHERRLIHRDIKGENFFLFEEQNQIRAKLGDFDSVCYEHEYSAKKHIRGTLASLAPEQANQIYKPEDVTSQASDMWSLGCLLFEFLNTADVPWYSRNEAKTLSAIQSLKSQELVLELINKKFNFLPHSHYGLAGVVLSLLNPIPEKRPTAKETYEKVCQICKLYGVI